MKKIPDPVDLTQKLIAFETVNPPGQERECCRYLAEILQEAGFRIDLYEFDAGRTNLVARTPTGNDSLPICFTGHLDTVPLGSADWRVNPFAGEIIGDKLYGRGSSDMKSGVAAMVVAALRFIRESVGSPKITLVLTAGEETGSQGARHLVGLENVLGKAAALVVAEPTANYPMVGHKGALWVEVRTSGVSAHGSMPDRGVNAIYKAVRLVDRLEGFDFEASPHPVLGMPTLNVGTISGGANINSVPDFASIGVDIRTVPGLSNQVVLDRLTSLLGREADIRRLVDVGSVATDPSDPWMQRVWDITAPFLDEPPMAKGVTYFTDASFLTPAFGNPPTVILGPGEPTMAHKTDEFCYLPKIEEAVEIYLKIMNSGYP